MILWWIVFFYLKIELDYGFYNMFKFDKPYVSSFTNSTSIFIYTITFLYNTYLGIFIKIFNENFLLFSKALGKCVDSKEYFISLLSSKKIKEKIVAEGENEFRKIIMKIILFYSSEGYKLYRYIGGSLIIDKLPISPNMVDGIKKDLKLVNNLNVIDNDKSIETASNVMTRELFELFDLLHESGFIEKNDVENLRDYHESKMESVTLLKRSARTKMSVIITHSILFGFYAIFFFMVPMLWLNYSIILGSFFYLLMVSIYSGVSSGIEKMKNIFEDPDDNYTISGKSVGYECHNYSATTFDSFEIYLSKLGLQIYFDEKNCYIGNKPYFI
jgi:hypothetical protein